ncbi:MAG: primase protein [Candidatus Kaiserbacteria bacterium GW2011_GWC2_52_8b]|uniref:DNA primase n=2 Tax=Candidatus Kaiseribacteriota TaxID=1752734 RepID=A0A0G1ZNT4_9BACT|nr:MAG: primase protein [Candidatus Kaiserbacteria bacterium GW2011_GWA2_52_12]KKW29807.1 MAG: primase protein [Candidatus Kaiserbacteria bacterium GW2011_GWC2_52_8b]
MLFIATFAFGWLKRHNDGMSDTVQQVKDKLSIVDVVSQYVKLERSGSSLRARCPFHAERTPSFFVSPERGTYHCFGCNVGGDIFSFVEQIEGLDFKGALKVLAEKAGVELVYERGGKEKKDERDRLFELMEVATIFYMSRLSDAAKKYLKERGMSDATVKEFRLGWAAGDSWSEASDYFKSKKFTDKEIVDAGLAKKGDRGLIDKFRNRIMFPINDSAGRVIAFSGRIFGENASPEAPKYLNSPETPLFHKSRILYGFDRAKLATRKHNCAVLVEGQMDFLASHQAGWGNTVAVSGTAFTPEHAALIHRMTDNLVLALDADEAGIKAAGRAARAALQGGLNVKVAQLPSGSDPAELILKEGKDAWSSAIRKAKDIITFLLDVLNEHSKSPDNFRRSVEFAVLPFLTDVQSPIAREQYIKEIAKRLGVSENAVAEAFVKLPRVPSATSTTRIVGDTSSEVVAKEKVSNRTIQAYALYLWQKTLAKPEIDVKKFEADFKEAIGPSAFKVVGEMPESHREPLRFSAEELYGKSPNLARETNTLLKVLLKERLSHELLEISHAIQQAEHEDNAKEIARLMGVHKMLTSQIALL